MKLLITGGAGFVASHLVDLALKNGDEVIGTVRWNEDLSRLNPKMQVEYCELTDLSSLIRAINKHRPDVISHLAAQSWVPYSFQNPIYTMEANAIGTLNILEAVRIIQEVEGPQKIYDPDSDLMVNTKYNPLIHICSSSEFYGKVPRAKQPITEAHPASPMNPYGVGKVAADLMSQLYEQYYDMRILITRMFTHTSPRRTMMSAEHFYAKKVAEIEKMHTHVAKGALVQIGEIPLGNMKSIRTWRDARDAVTDYYALYVKQMTGIYNISGDTVRSIQEVLDFLLDNSKVNKDKIRFFEDPSLLRKVDVDIQQADTSKFSRIIQQTHTYNFEQTMLDILDEWRARVRLER